MPEQHTVAPNMRFLVPELAYFSYAKKNAQLAIVLFIILGAFNFDTFKSTTTYIWLLQ